MTADESIRTGMSQAAQPALFGSGVPNEQQRDEKSLVKL